MGVLVAALSVALSACSDDVVLPPADESTSTTRPAPSLTLPAPNSVELDGRRILEGAPQETLVCSKAGGRNASRMPADEFESLDEAIELFGLELIEEGPETPELHEGLNVAVYSRALRRDRVVDADVFAPSGTDLAKLCERVMGLFGDAVAEWRHNVEATTFREPKLVVECHPGDAAKDFDWQADEWGPVYTSITDLIDFVESEFSFSMTSRVSAGSTTMVMRGRPDLHVDDLLRMCALLESQLGEISAEFPYHVLLATPFPVPPRDD